MDRKREWERERHIVDKWILLMLPGVVIVVDLVVWMLLHNAEAITWKFKKFKTEN
jgi:hypothetical protein